MLDSLLDYGYPMITQKFVLESMIKPSGVMEKIEEAIIGRQNVQKDNQHIHEKYVDSQADMREHSQYRITEIKGDEEIFFDVLEYLDCVIDKSITQLASSIFRNGRYIVEEINGEIKMDCNLSGIPDVYIFLNQPNQFNDYTVHECLLNRIDTYEREKVLNLTPPTGHTTIFYYNLSGIQVKVPFDFIPKLSFTDNSARIELKVANRPVRGQSYAVEEFHVKLITPAGITLGETELQQGQLSQLENAILWRIGKLDIDHNAKLVVTFNNKTQGDTSIKNGNYIACLKFTINQFTSSSTKIEKVEVRNAAKVLSKKARNIAKSGYYEIRLN